MFVTSRHGKIGAQMNGSKLRQEKERWRSNYNENKQHKW